MSLESVTYISDLNSSNPGATDGMSQGDDHIRNIKAGLLATFPNITGAVTPSHTKLNNGAVPTGTIVLWYSTSASIPTGWTACDGVLVAREDGGGNITPPDLRDKFVVAAGSTYTQGSTGGSTTSSSNGAHTHAFTSNTDGSHTHGGVTGSHTLTTAEMPAHTHQMFAAVSGNSGSNYPLSTEQVARDNSTGGSGSYDTFGTATAATLGLTSSTGSGGGHTHTISSTGSTHSHAGTTDSDGAHTHTVTPPYYALVYMMRK